MITWILAAVLMLSGCAAVDKPNTSDTTIYPQVVGSKEFILGVVLALNGQEIKRTTTSYVDEGECKAALDRLKKIQDAHKKSPYGEVRIVECEPWMNPAPIRAPGYEPRTIKRGSKDVEI